MTLYHILHLGKNGIIIFGISLPGTIPWWKGVCPWFKNSFIVSSFQLLSALLEDWFMIGYIMMMTRAR